MNNSGSKEEIRIIDWYYYWVYRLQLKLSGPSDPHGWAFHTINVQIMVVLFAIALVLQYALIEGLNKQEYNLVMVLCVVSLGYLVTYFIVGDEESRKRRTKLIEKQSKKKYRWLLYIVPLISIGAVWVILGWFFIWST
ncbi:hypothetical protein [Sulfuriflexus sp.]|uniref:hypothetical protein n=1 Tax=Sulfuriflexus sp. TaxID=2015443 RepID=UPI0028CED908|nr:hypothetical protein [Sulfuriflexus sp.]MDT8405562.1 hypothetical protein [Sulfuriflexus sp.]